MNNVILREKILEEGNMLWNKFRDLELIYIQWLRCKEATGSMNDIRGVLSIGNTFHFFNKILAKFNPPIDHW